MASQLNDIKKRITRYLLQRYLGQFLLEKLTLSQLSVNLSEGKGSVEHLQLDCAALNETLAEQAVPIQLVNGSIKRIDVTVPFSSLLSDSCEILIYGLELTIQPKHRPSNGGSMVDSMWSSMASSMQLAEDCLRNQEYEEDTDENGMERTKGVEKFAQAIDAVLKRVKMEFIGCKIRIEHRIPNRNIKCAAEIIIESCDYCNETAENMKDGEMYETPFSSFLLNFSGIKCFTDLYSDPPNDLSTENSNNSVFAKINGSHSVRIKVKSSDNYVGPQIELDGRIGSILSILTPMQAHCLSFLLNECISPSTDSASTETQRSQREKPMQSFDFKMVQDELEKELKPRDVGTRGFQNLQGWSSLCDESDDEFLPFSSDKGMEASVSSNVLNASYTSVQSSMQDSTENYVMAPLASSQHSMLSDSRSKSVSVDRMKFSITCASLVLVVLHEDTLTLNREWGPADSVKEHHRSISSRFFEGLSMFSVTTGISNMMELRKILADSCQKSCHRFLAAPLKFEGSVQNINSNSVFSGCITGGFAELTEYLEPSHCSENELMPKVIEVVTFPSYDRDKDIFNTFRVNFKHTGFISKMPAWKLSLKVTLKDAMIEADISVIDRISSLLFPTVFGRFDLNQKNSPLGELQPQLKNSKFQTKFQLHALKCWINFRFPVPDLRKEQIRGVSSGRIPYFVRNLREDSVILDACNLQCRSFVSSTSSSWTLDILCSEAKLYYRENQEDKTDILIGTIIPDGEAEGDDNVTANTRISITVNPKEKEYEEEFREVKKQSEPVSMVKTVLDPKLTEAPDITPFSGRRIVRHTSCDIENPDNDEESLIPGDAAEIERFIEHASKKFIYRVVIHIQDFEANLPSKNIFEALYNRISTDLLLWEPSSPKFLSSLENERLSNRFSMCNSFYDGTEDEDERYCSIGSMSSGLKCYQSEFIFSLNADRGSLSFKAPILETENDGKIEIKAEKLQFFLVSGHKGDPSLGYFCLNSQKAWMYHADNLAKSGVLVRTIFPSEDNVCYHSPSSSDDVSSNYTDMLLIAGRIERLKESHLKNFKISMAIKNGTLNYKVYPTNCHWFSQLLEFFNVIDVPVEGYMPYRVVTEFHFHLWNSAIDYLPKYLPYRTVLTLENFTISSNIIAQTNTSILKLLSEDAAFFITSNNSSTDLKSDYICIMDMEYMELRIKTCRDDIVGLDGLTVPRLEFVLTNNVLNIRSCSDSFRALVDVITYLAKLGDLKDDLKSSLLENSSFVESASSCQEENDRAWDPSPTNADLLEMENEVSDAMKEEAPEQVTLSLESQREYNNVELTYVPDESEAISHSEPMNVPDSDYGMPYGAPVVEYLNPTSLHDEDDEEFCILEDDLGVGILPTRNGEPKAKVLTEKPIRLIDNHFSPPSEKLDVLKAPKHFPSPTTKYLLQDVSIVWHLFGGSDFQEIFDKGSTQSLNRNGMRRASLSSLEEGNDIEIGVDTVNSDLDYYRSKAFEDSQGEIPSVRRKYDKRLSGGKGRRYDKLVELHLSKVKVQYEMYPDHCLQSRRMVVVAKNIEIWDRLKSSEYNKMLYLYTSPNRPRQTNANMVVVKALHEKPEARRNFEECSLRISLLPLRLNLDHDALMFVYEFFQEMSKSELAEEDCSSNVSKSKSSSVESLPILSVPSPLNRRKGTPSNHSGSTCSLDECVLQVDEKSTDSDVDKSIQYKTYFKSIIFSPDVPIKLDYRGKVDMKQGPVAGLLLVLAQINCSEIKLKEIRHRNGILGPEKVAAFLLNEWKNDIRRNQLQNVLGGVGPFHSFVQIFQGIKDLFYMPYEQYSKDGRVTKGLKRGVASFSTSSAMAALELTNRFVKTVQYAAELAYDMVSPGPSFHQRRRYGQEKKKKRSSRPCDIKDGVVQACNVVREGFQDAAQTMVEVAIKEQERKGVTGAVGGVIRQIPPSVVQTIILSSKATSNVIGGVISQIEPESKKDAEDKWKES